MYCVQQNPEEVQECSSPSNLLTLHTLAHGGSLGGSVVPSRSRRFLPFPSFSFMNSNHPYLISSARRCHSHRACKYLSNGMGDTLSVRALATSTSLSVLAGGSSASMLRCARESLNNSKLDKQRRRNTRRLRI